MNLVTQGKNCSCILCISINLGSALDFFFKKYLAFLIKDVMLKARIYLGIYFSKKDSLVNDKENLTQNSVAKKLLLFTS